jgi:hypothetical protein
MKNNEPDVLVRALLGLPTERPQATLGDLLSGPSIFGNLNPAPNPRSIDWLSPPSPVASPLFSLGEALLPIASPPARPAARLRPANANDIVAVPQVQRMTYFAFDFDDVMRVNNVRQNGKVGSRVIRNSRGFLDRSIWESRNIKNEQHLKRLMSGAVKHSSVICVLTGANTWQSRWVRYEIALAVIDKRGLLSIHINSINHNVRRATDLPGINPLHVMGIYRDANGKNYLVEKQPVEMNSATGDIGFQWRLYRDYTLPVSLPRNFPDMDVGAVVPLSSYTDTYDFMGQEGSKNIGSWLDLAATKVGR